MEGIDPSFFELVYKYGVVPVLTVAVVVLWRDNIQNRKAIANLNEAQKQDIRNHAAELGGVHQNTINTLNQLNSNIENTLDRIDK